MKILKKVVLASSLAVFSLHAQASEKVTVLLDWFVNPDHAPLVIAQQKGFFKEQGLEVEMVEPADPSMPPKLVAAGKADMAVTYQPQLHMQIDEGLPLTRVATLVDNPLNSVVVLDKSDIQSIKDLKGKKVGFSVGGFEEVLLGAMLNHHGLSLKDVELINVNWSLSPSLITQKTDAVIGAFRNFELNQMDIEQHPGRAFFVEEHGVPVYEELILVINNKDRNQTDKWKRFNQALTQAVHYIHQDTEQAWHDFVSYKPTVLETELNRRAWKDTLPYLAKEPAKLVEKRYADFAEFMYQQSLIKKVLPVESYAITP
ncbi:ABC transporter substrate-binding protein [Pelistega sp. NLN82]|uniref:ABC transporter substrate-binding protein n=1 Tax=Pelistega ratti TaxID=2652177 RepID=A0A6L9Y3D1_9BURK|nr:ABC transporter substrate-binding protein [Pelistega ratti]NEN74803.1 ABC transporter substrate-binding protein [Pelistega ratti]